MKAVSASIQCPSCSGPLQTRALECVPCGVELKGHFEQNEFASLDVDSLHLLRIFIHCEGSIREMEAALGLSYPTIKARLAELRKRLAPPEPVAAPPAPPLFQAADAGAVLDAFQAGKIPYEQALKALRKRKKEV
jgi:hypothetical protein